MLHVLVIKQPTSARCVTVDRYIVITQTLRGNAQI